MPSNKHLKTANLIAEGFSPRVISSRDRGVSSKKRLLSRREIDSFFQSRDVPAHARHSFFQGASRITDNRYEYELIECSSGAVLKRYGAVSDSGHPMGRFFTLVSVEDLSSIGLGEFYLDAQGIKQARQAHYFILKQPAMFLVSYAKRITDTFSVPGENQYTKGGEVQYFILSPLEHLACIDNAPLRALSKDPNIEYGMSNLYSAVISAAFIARFHPQLAASLGIAQITIPVTEWSALSREQIIEQLLTISSEELLRLLAGLQIGLPEEGKKQSDYSSYGNAFNKAIFTECLDTIANQTPLAFSIDLSSLQYYAEVKKDSYFMESVSDQLAKAQKEHAKHFIYLLIDLFTKEKVSSSSSLGKILQMIQQKTPNLLDMLARKLQESITNIAFGNHFDLFKVYLRNEYRDQLEQLIKPVLRLLTEIVVRAFTQQTRWSFAICDQISVSISEDIFKQALTSLYFVKSNDYVPSHLKPEQVCVVRDPARAQQLRQLLLQAHANFVSLTTCIDECISFANQPEDAFGFISFFYRLFNEHPYACPLPVELGNTPTLAPDTGRFASEAEMHTLKLNREQQLRFYELFMAELTVAIDSLDPIDIEELFGLDRFIPPTAQEDFQRYLSSLVHQAEEYLCMEFNGYQNYVSETTTLANLVKDALHKFNNWEHNFPDMVGGRFNNLAGRLNIKDELWVHYRMLTMHKLDSNISQLKHLFINLLSSCMHTASVWASPQQSCSGFSLSSSPIQSKYCRAVVLYRPMFFGRDASPSTDEASYFQLKSSVCSST